MTLPPYTYFETSRPVDMGEDFALSAGRIFDALSALPAHVGDAVALDLFVDPNVFLSEVGECWLRRGEGGRARLAASLRFSALVGKDDDLIFALSDEEPWATIRSEFFTVAAEFREHFPGWYWRRGRAAPGDDPPAA